MEMQVGFCECGTFGFQVLVRVAGENRPRCWKCAKFIADYHYDVGDDWDFEGCDNLEDGDGGLLQAFEDKCGA